MTCHFKQIRVTKLIKNCIIVLVFFVFWSCNNSSHTPKPKGYNRIDVPEYNYRVQQFPFFAFNISQLADISKVDNQQKGFWFDIVYPAYNATLYCSYMPVAESGLRNLLEDSYKLAYSHVSMADGIEQRLFSYPETQVSGIVYYIGGDVASPIHFFATDSVANFLRGSLYFTQQIKPDSVAPVIYFINNDIGELLGSLKWASPIKK